MKIKSKFLQQGGTADSQAAPDQSQAAPDQSQGGAPAGDQGQQQDPMAQILQAAQQAVEQKNPDLALQVCAALVQLVQQSQGGGQQQQPMMQKRGGKIVGKVRK